MALSVPKGAKSAAVFLVEKSAARQRLSHRKQVELLGSLEDKCSVTMERDKVLNLLQESGRNKNIFFRDKCKDQKKKISSLRDTDALKIVIKEILLRSTTEYERKPKLRIGHFKKDWQGIFLKIMALIPN